MDKTDRNNDTSQCSNETPTKHNKLMSLLHIINLSHTKNVFSERASLKKNLKKALKLCQDFY